MTSAEDFVRTRWLQIQQELKRVEVDFEPRDVFQSPKSERGLVAVLPRPQTRLGIVVATSIPGLLNSQVVLGIVETYSCASIAAGASQDPQPLEYSYQFS